MNNMLVNSLGLLLVSSIPDLKREVSNLEIPAGTNQKSPNKSLLYLTKGPEKGKTSRTENF